MDFLAAPWHLMPKPDPVLANLPPESIVTCEPVKPISNESAKNLIKLMTPSEKR